jgi:hypothetical protein
MSMQSYLREFTNSVDIINYAPGTIGMSPRLGIGLVDEHRSTGSRTDQKQISA